MRSVFAYYGDSRKIDDVWVQQPHSVIVLLDESERLAVLEDRRAYVPAHLGPSGWVGLDLVEKGSVSVTARMWPTSQS